MTTRTVLFDALFDAYGALLTYEQLSKVLGRSEGGLRVSMCRDGSDAGKLLRKARLTIGRRVYFRTDRIVDLIETVSDGVE